MSAPTPPKISGAGMLYVVSRIASKDMSEETYLKWYEEDHIAEIMQTSGIKSAVRFKNTNLDADKPYMVMYPMEDLGFTQGEEFKKIKVHSNILPGGGPIYDLADIDVRYYSLTQTYDPKGPTKPGKVKLINTAGLSPNETISDNEFDNWYRQEHLDELAKVPGYLRSTRYNLQYYRTNAQSRALKGLPARAEDIAIKTPPRFFAVHEFDTDDIDIKALMATVETDWSKRIMGNLAEPFEGNFWALKGSFGDKTFFQEAR
ncbi:hypothetical protein BJ878DRAFT_529093 [Calycina marina]|uniref:Uncharacterized protein n=1 Tax=Calycina marina TaxID=1763456 RepID=A0A9P7YUH9_9HELO|nr:hypothetical protein BJ878DRAFT_529093 [Calycina marina]